VAFSRYELIELLGWPQSGPSYRRIEEALHRWVGVVLMYENAWWDNAAKSWVDENFHVLDNVSLYARERTAAGPEAGQAGGPADRPAGQEGPRGAAAPLPLSSFRWNEVIFQSFQSGNLKQLDLEFYLGSGCRRPSGCSASWTSGSIAATRLDFDLRTLACEHIGLSRSYAPTELKRRLKPALEELESLGFLEPLGPEERYSYVARGQWRIILIRARPTPRRGPPRGEGARARRGPGQRGVAAKVAGELVAEDSAGRIQTKLEVFDWLVRIQDKRVAKNPAGYLVASIRDDYQPPSTTSRPAPARKAEADGAAKEAEEAEQAPTSAASRRGGRGFGREASLRVAWEACPRPSVRPSWSESRPPPRPPPLEDDARAPLPRRAGAPVRGRTPGARKPDQGRLFDTEDPAPAGPDRRPEGPHSRPSQGWRTERNSPRRLRIPSRCTSSHRGSGPGCSPAAPRR
jgi:hypothetical protein